MKSDGLLGLNFVKKKKKTHGNHYQYHIISCIQTQTVNIYCPTPMQKKYGNQISKTNIVFGFGLKKTPIGTY